MSPWICAFTGRSPQDHAPRLPILKPPWHDLSVRALLIEDDPKLGELTREYLEHRDMAVTLVADGDTGLKEALSGDYDVVLLDLMLPGIGGLEICKRLRRECAVPLIILSARGDEVDKIVGLELGADDYLSKPYSPRELLARIHAVLRRGSPTERPAEVARAGPLVVDRTRRTASLAGTALDLTAYQFDVLWILCQAPERVFSRKQIYQQVRSAQDLSPEPFDPSIDRSVDVHLSKVRQALDGASPGASALVKTVRGVGYVFQPDALEASES